MLTQALAVATSTLLVVLLDVAINVERVIIARIFVLINFILTQPEHPDQANGPEVPLESVAAYTALPSSKVQPQMPKPNLIEFYASRRRSELKVHKTQGKQISFFFFDLN